MTSLSTPTPLSGQHQHPFKTSSPRRQLFIPSPQSSPNPFSSPLPTLTSARPPLICIPPQFPSPPRVLHKSPSTSKLYHHNRSSTFMSDATRHRSPPGASASPDVSYHPLQPFLPHPSSPFRIDRLRLRKHSNGPPLSASRISPPSSTIRLSCNPTQASAQLGFNSGYPVTPPDLPSIHGVFDKFHTVQQKGQNDHLGPSRRVTMARKPPPPIDTSGSSMIDRHNTLSKKGRRDTLQLPMMGLSTPTQRSAGAIAFDKQRQWSSPQADINDLSDWDVLSDQSILQARSATTPSSSSHSSQDPTKRRRNDGPSPVPTTLTKSTDWLDSEAPSAAPALGQPPLGYAPNEMNLRAIEVLEHFSGHLLSDGWGDELDEYNPPRRSSRHYSRQDPKSAPAVPAKSNLRNQQQSPPSRTAPPLPPTPSYAMSSGLESEDWDADSIQSHGGRRDEHDAASVRSWREARKKSKPPTLRPLSEQPPIGSNSIQPGSISSHHRIERATSSHRLISPNTPPRSTSLTPGLKLTRPSVESRDMPYAFYNIQEQEEPTKGGMRRVSSALSRKSSDEKKKSRIKVPLLLDFTHGSDARSPASPPSSPVPFQHRPLPPLPGSSSRSSMLPSRSSSSGPSALLQLRFQRELLRPKRPSTSSQSQEIVESHDVDPLSSRPQIRKLSARDEPRPGAPLSPRMDTADKQDRRRGMTALSFLAMEEMFGPDEPIPLDRHAPGPVVVEHILPPGQLSKIVPETSDRRDSWSSSSTSTTSLSNDNEARSDADDSRLNAQPHSRPIADRTVRKSASMDRAKSKSKRTKTDNRKSMGQTSINMSMSSPAIKSPFSTLNPFDSEEDKLPTRSTALPPPPRPRHSYAAQKDARQIYGHLSSPPMPESVSSPISAVRGERPQTFMALSRNPSFSSRYSPLTTRPNSPTSETSHAVSPVALESSQSAPAPHSLELTCRQREPGPSPIASVFGLNTLRNPAAQMSEAATTSLPSATLPPEATPSHPVDTGKADELQSISTSATSRRDVEREEKDRVLREWLKSKPRRGTGENIGTVSVTPAENVLSSSGA
ncbi:hypothetical protein BD324DRAFT_103788 [Kockovaella imperatae]|uniref:Uncharacterized protein n=1 Tax=Kockovaella imperatae TaxID=4999 RepID=A0A1Y1UA59_9TREE|nr:hypothetical protein BD324DRAFT_103788 [Kockovaella imperatae]ORX34908.1 hypothetical protein BD324DRAFT_103788 [Kockovaella imperatae]